MKETPVLRLPTRSELDADAAIAEAAVCRALFEMCWARSDRNVDDFINRVSQIVGNA